MVGKNIKKFREESKMSQETLAENLHVTRQAVSNWENEKTQPDIEMLQSIAQALDVSVEELIYGKSTRVIENHYHQNITNITKNIPDISKDVSIKIGTGLAMILSYVKWHSIGWAILHGFMNWGYVIYYIIRYN